MAAHWRAASRFNASNRYAARYASTAEYVVLDLMMSPTIGSRSFGPVAMKSPTAAKRSATHGPEYNNAAAARNGVKSIVTRMPPSASRRSTAFQYRSRACASPKNSSVESDGVPNRQDAVNHGAASPPTGAVREYGSPASCACATCQTVAASAAIVAKIDTQSSDRHAGTTPDVLSKRRVGFRPTRLLNAAGTRPEPAVSVPSENTARPLATATAGPELDPPQM